MTITKQMVINKLVELALEDGFLKDNYARVRGALMRGEELPKGSKPGALLSKLTEEELEVLKTCTEEDWRHRLK